MSGRSRLVLVVEDEPGFREPLEYLLRLRAYDVITADTAEKALEVLHTRQPDAAIVDLHLKRGSGRDVVVRMPSRAPVIIFSGMRSASGELERLRPRTRLVEKPASLTWLVDTLEEMLDAGLVDAPPALQNPLS
ncbi:MAG: response regulator [Vicinamibacterales bacterium]